VTYKIKLNRGRRGGERGAGLREVVVSTVTT